MKLLKIRTGIVFFIAVVFTAAGFAQSLKRTVVSSGGKFSSNGSGALYSNIGELQITTLTDTVHYITQGFVQPFTNFPVSVSPIDAFSSEVNVFPNPSTETIYFTSANHKSVFICIYDTQGRLLLRKENIELNPVSRFPLSILSLTNGVYFVKISENTGNSHVYRFVKT